MPEKTNTQGKTAEEQAAQTTQQEQSLENFDWDTDGTGDFFGIANTAVEQEEDIIEKIKTDDVIETTPNAEEGTTPPASEKGTEEEEDEEGDEVFFGLKEDEETGKTVETEEAEEKEQGTNLTAYAKKLKENGIFQNVEIPEEEEITDDKFIELQDLEVESRVDEAFDSFFTELDEDGAAFLRHKKNGGTTEDFFKTYGASTGLPEGDLDDEQYQEKVSRYYYEQVEKDSVEDIDDKIEWLKDTGKLEKYSQKFDEKIKLNDKKKKEDLAKATKEAAKAEEEGRKAFVSSVQEALDSTDQVDNFIFTKESKKSLLPFITKPTIKVGKNKYVTGMQSKLGTALKDPAKMLVLAQLLQNDFDVTSIVQNAETIKTKKLKDDIQRNKGVRPTSSGKTGRKRSLADVDF